MQRFLEGFELSLTQLVELNICSPPHQQWPGPIRKTARNDENATSKANGVPQIPASMACMTANNRQVAPWLRADCNGACQPLCDCSMRAKQPQSTVKTNHAKFQWSNLKTPKPKK